MYAVGMIEVLSIPLGILAGDAMMKAARVSLITAGTVCAGKYTVMVSGETAAVESAVRAGEEVVENTLVDSMLIPNVDARVVAAVAGASAAEDAEAIGVLETFSLAAAVRAADAAVKAAAGELIEVRLGRGMGGKSFVLLTGDVASVEAAVAAAENSEGTQGLMARSVVIPAPHKEIVRALL
jgi:microcompartment protein CcmL/EutN